MNERLSKLMRTVIILNVIATIIACGIHGYYIHRSFETNQQVNEKMAERQVIRGTAIRMLEEEGVDLYFPRSITEYSGVIISLATLFILYVYSQTNGFMSGFFAAFFAVFTTYIGGFLLFYVFLSGKSESPLKRSSALIKNDWELYIHQRGTAA